MIDSQLKERVKKFLSYCRISNTEFAEIASVTPAYINSIKKNISFEVLEKIAELNPRLNLAWLLWGKGEMLTDVSDFQKIIEENENLKRENAYLQKIVDLYERNENGTKTK